VGIKARGNLAELPKTTFMIVIHWESNGNNIILSSNQLQASYMNVRHWEELIDLIDKNGGLNEQYILTSKIKCPLEQDELDE